MNAGKYKPSTWGEWIASWVILAALTGIFAYLVFASKKRSDQEVVVVLFSAMWILNLVEFAKWFGKRRKVQ